MDFPDVIEAGVDPDTGQLGLPVNEAGLEVSCVDLVTPTQPQRKKPSIVDRIAAISS